MYLAWVWLVPTAYFFAAFMKPAMPKRGAWFQVSVNVCETLCVYVCMYTCFPHCPGVSDPHLHLDQAPSAELV